MKTPFQESRFLRHLLDSSPDAIVCADASGRILLYNSGAEELLGYQREEVLATIRFEHLWPEGEARRILEAMRERAREKKGGLSRVECMCRTQAGQQIPVSLSGGLVFDEQGSEQAVLVIFRDLRPLLQMQAKLLQAEKMAGMGKLAAGVAHELNNPLSGIMLYAGLLKERLGADQAAADDLQTIIEHADRCRRIVADLLEFARPFSLQRQVLDVNQLLRQVTTQCVRMPDFEGLQVTMELADDAPPIYADRTRLTQVFTNILYNAAQALQHQGVIRLSTSPRAEGQLLAIEISDNGPGIAVDVLPRIFDPFFTTKGGGTGLGLAIAYSIVREHGGTIRAESVPGQGATFILHFPAWQLSQAVDGAPAATKKEV